MGPGSIIIAALLGAAAAAAPSAERESRLILENYPPGSLKAGEEGTVGFQATLDRDGKLASCVVTRSSGYPRLDKATCDMIVETARFGLSEKRGSKRTPTHNYFVEWKLPAGYAKGPPPAPVRDETKTETKLADAKLICKRSQKVGSIIIQKKVCLTKDDWARAEEFAKEETQRLQTPKGPINGPF
jgi:TonB family protein